ncbi:mitochondrial dynamics protein MID49 [Eublepharis macularius]|uniref:Mitochondrial dynamics protein MID49 n=1 Tax=Eublepharis macularius TaxID=481883 RepID=A0AA97JZ43_EUBMA|nr:mitochondrial dynamics protein MID49 [Eublepharis macularius]XP_054848290.1 mitochondrial dynamics protein MID49 [Eublepharis macularius]
MAGYAQKQGKRSDGTGLAGVVDFLLANARVVLGVSGAAVLAIATLAVKRLIDRATSPPDDDSDMKAKQKSLEESWQELSLIQTMPKSQLPLRREKLEEPLLSPVVDGTTEDPEDVVPSSEMLPAKSKTQLCLTLQEKLLSRYQDHISVSEAKKILGKQLSKDICAELQDFLKNKCSELPFGNAFLSGYLCDGLIGGGTLEVAFMLPLVLESSLWTLIPGEQTVVNNPCFWMIKRTSLEYFPRGNSPWDRFMVGGYLSSNAISSALRKVLVASINWPAISSMLGCVVRPVMAPEELKLEVRHEQIHLDITLCPMMESGDKTLLAASLKEPVENLWQQSFYATEVSKLKDLDARDSGIRQCCLHLLKDVFEIHPFWCKLTSSHLIHVLLHLSETESDWSEAALAIRFRQVLEELLQFLEEGSLPCYFDSRINLLGHLRLEEIDDIGYTLYEALAEPDLWSGLGL